MPPSALLLPMLDSCCSIATLPGPAGWPFPRLSDEQDKNSEWCSPQGGPHSPPPGAIPPCAFVEGVTIGVEKYALPAYLRRYANIDSFGFLPLRILNVDWRYEYGQQQRGGGGSPSKVSDECSTAASAQMRPPRRSFLPKLGNRGRAKLRGRIAAAARGYSREWRNTKGIGRLNTATIAQLIDMADQLGLSDYVDSLSIQQFGPQNH